MSPARDGPPAPGYGPTRAPDRRPATSTARPRYRAAGPGRCRTARPRRPPAALLPGASSGCTPSRRWRRAWAPLAALSPSPVHDLEQRHASWSEHLTAGVGGCWRFAVLRAAAPPLYGFLSWWCTSYLVTDTELRIRTGLFFRRAAHIRLDRIQAVDITRPLLARVAGVAKLKLDVVGTDVQGRVGRSSARRTPSPCAPNCSPAPPASRPRPRTEAGEAPAQALLRLRPRTLAVSAAADGRHPGALLAARRSSSRWVSTSAPDSVWRRAGGRCPARRRRLGARSAGASCASTTGRSPSPPTASASTTGCWTAQHATVPPGRVQAVRIVEPLLWRRRGWVRVELQIAGAGRPRERRPAPARRRGDEAAAVLIAGCCRASTWTRPSPRPCPRRAVRAGASRLAARVRARGDADASSSRARGS